MTRFIVGHAAHPDWKGALALAGAQLDGFRAGVGAAAQEANLGLVYFTDHYAPHAQALYDALHARWPGVAWAGTVGVGVCASGVEYFDEPALVLMLSDMPVGRFRVFSGAKPLGTMEPATALVHADGNTHELSELLDELAGRTASGYLFGGIAASRARSCQIAEGVFEGGLSGVAFSRDVGIVSRVTQGCQPIGPQRRITACERNVVTELDGEPALQCLLDDLQLTLDEPREKAAGRADVAAVPSAAQRSPGDGLGGRQQMALALRSTLVGLAAPAAAMPVAGGIAARSRHRAFGDDVRVRHLVGLDPGRHGVAVADVVETGMTLAFCQRDVHAARRDLTRICAEIREELAPDPAAGSGSRISGAVYVSCAGRGGAHFGAPSAELQLIRHALGDVPLAGFFAGGEIGHQHLYGYTGVLTVFTAAAAV